MAILAGDRREPLPPTAAQAQVSVTGHLVVVCGGYVAPPDDKLKTDSVAVTRGRAMAVVSDDVLQLILTRLTNLEKQIASVVAKGAATYQLLLSVYQAEGAELMSLQDVLTKVEAQTTVIAGVETLLSDLNTRLKDAIASEDPAKLQQISDELDANTTRIAAAISANTQNAPTPQP